MDGFARIMRVPKYPKYLKLPIKEDKMDEAVAAIKELAKDVAKEEGTLFH
jgi:quinol monooxygenase YgiN